MAFGDPAVVVASAARTATGNSGDLTLGDKGAGLALVVDVTAVSGTSPSMTLSVEWSQDGGTTFGQADPVDVFTAITAAATKTKSFTVKGDHYRLVWTISGTTPSFTFSIRRYITR
jgi:hypothetical protein